MEWDDEIDFLQVWRILTRLQHYGFTLSIKCHAPIQIQEFVPKKIKWRKSAFSLAFFRFMSDSNINQINIFFQVLWLLLYLEVSRTSAEEYEPRSTTRRIGSRQKCLLKTHKNSGRQTNPKGLGDNKVVKNNRLGLDYNWPHKSARWVGLELPNNLVGSTGRGPE